MIPLAGASCCPTKRLAGCRRTTPNRRARSALTSPIGTISRSSTMVSAPCRAGMALPASAASRCWSSCGSGPANWASNCVSNPSSVRPGIIAAIMIWWSRPMASTRLSARNTPRSSNPRSIRACASSFGSARSRNSTMPSPSSSRRPRMAGSGRMPINSMTAPRPSSSNAARRPGTARASRTCRRKTPSKPAAASSPAISAAMR